MVFCGGLIPVTGRPVLDQLSWAIPARCGFAATASTTDLRAISPQTPQNETLWSHHVGWWLLEHDRPYCFRRGPDRCVRWRIRLGALSPTGQRSARRRWFLAVRRPMPMPLRLPTPEHHHTLLVAAGGTVSIPVLLGEVRST